MEDFRMKNVSYMHARDPSILSFNRPQLNCVRVNLEPELKEDETERPEKSNNINVFLRIKAGYNFENLYQVCDNTLKCNVPPDAHSMRNVREGENVRRMYTFTKIFQPNTTQTDIFNDVVKPKMLDFINGNNSTLLTYGASGSGKTFTVTGTDEEPGLIPRSLEYLFRTVSYLDKDPLVKPLATGGVSRLSDSGCKRERQLCHSFLNSSTLDKTHHARTYLKMQQRLSSEPVGQLDNDPNISISVWVSFAEIYNEHIYDLLQRDPPRGQQRPKLRLGTSNGTTYIKNLTSLNVADGLEAFQILQYGVHNQNYAATNINAHSSRSHSIFTIKLVQVNHEDGGAYINNFNFCDLAGSERSKKTKNVGDRLKESNNINSSLLVLGRCISGVRCSQRQNDNKLVPFRESKLTQLFQKALSGFEDIAMIVNVSPARDMFDETQHVLHFSAVAKEIAIEHKAPVLKPKKGNRFSTLIQQRPSEPENVLGELERLRNSVALLESELEHQRVDFEVNEQLSREYIINGYKDLLKQMEHGHAEEIKTAQEVVRLEYDTKMANLRKHYEKMLEQRSEVISLDSSDDDEDLVEYRKTIEEQRVAIGRLQKLVGELRLENEALKAQSCEEVVRLQKEVGEMKGKCVGLEGTLDDAVSEFRELEGLVKTREDRIVVLEDRIYQLEMELATYREEMTELITDCASSGPEDDFVKDQDEFLEDEIRNKQDIEIPNEPSIQVENDKENLLLHTSRPSLILDPIWMTAGSDNKIFDNSNSDTLEQNILREMNTTFENC